MGVLVDRISNPLQRYQNAAPIPLKGLRHSPARWSQTWFFLIPHRRCLALPLRLLDPGHPASCPRPKIYIRDKSCVSVGTALASFLGAVAPETVIGALSEAENSGAWSVPLRGLMGVVLRFEQMWSRCVGGGSISITPGLGFVISKLFDQLQPVDTDCIGR